MSFQRSHFEHLDWYAGKAEIRQYLSDLNRDKKVTKTINIFLVQNHLLKHDNIRF